MKRKKSSIIWEPSKKEFQKIIDEASTYCDVLRHFGFNGHRGNHRTLKKRIKEDNICLKKFKENNRKYKEKLIIKRKIPDSEIFKENSTYNNSSLKRKIIQEELLPYECSKCKNLGSWQNEELVLQLDHINGINNDNRLENLRLLCPNCHSQTKTFSGKKAKKKNNCINCKIEIKSRTSKYCSKCRKEFQEKTCHKKKFNPSKEEFIKKIKELNSNFVQLGKFYGVSDNAIRKRCRKLNIDWKSF